MIRFTKKDNFQFIFLIFAIEMALFNVYLAKKRILGPSGVNILSFRNVGRTCKN